MYHTQEKRRTKLTSPIMCINDNAWLGEGYYFWNDILDAIFWGHESKKRTGYFEIYNAEIDCENILDTVFNEEHYNFWVKQIEKAAKHFIKTADVKPTIKEINEYFTEVSKWTNKFNGILFQDLPYSKDLLVQNLYYRKRIQMVVFNLDIIRNFAFHSDMKCN